MQALGQLCDKESWCGTSWYKKKKELLVHKVDWNRKQSMLVRKIMISRRIHLFMSGR